MEQLKHECGVAMVRLRKPVVYYEKKYGTARWGLNKLYLMMEKQHNRGQEGAGVAAVHLQAEPGQEYMFRQKAEGVEAITEIFKKIENGELSCARSEELRVKSEEYELPESSEGKSYSSFRAEGAILHSSFQGEADHSSFQGEADLLMGHLRYSTTGKRGLQYVHPFLRRNNWRAKNLCLCGNFNMTNIDEVFSHLTAQGQYPRIYSDSYIMLELMGHRLDREVERLFAAGQKKGLRGTALTEYIDSHVDIARVLTTTMPWFDGGYVVCGLTGSGEFFAMRDPHGIRPAYYFISSEVVALASERPVLQTTFDLHEGQVLELEPGCALIVRRNGTCRMRQILPPKQKTACSFERIYFSRGNDADIYRERKRLGELLVPAVTKAVEDDVENTVFSFIPNTAEVAYYGLLHGFMQKGHAVRFEKIAWKDIKLRTFIAEDQQRSDLAAHVYDVTYGVVRPQQDNLVVIDDSIVRGTTLKESILTILARLHPRRIVMVSSAPQIRYPDYYGIDMARLEELIAFRACMALLREGGHEDYIHQVYVQCKAELEGRRTEERIPVALLYEPYSTEEISAKMVELLRPDGVTTPIRFVFQTPEGLHEACPRHQGDWYFTGHYPTPGGRRMCCQAFVNYYENRYDTNTQ